VDTQSGLWAGSMTGNASFGATTDVFEEPFRLAARIDHARLLRTLIEPVVGTTEAYYFELSTSPTGRPERMCGRL